MLVHRDKDGQSGGDDPLKGRKGARPRLVSDNPGCGAKSALSGQAADDGKTHLIGDALKSVYQRTLEEDIPDDFLDLLKQLK